MKKIFITILFITGFAAFAEAQAISDIKKVDFRSFTFEIGDLSIKMKDGLQVGACQEKDEDGVAMGDIWNVSAESVAYGDLNGDGQPEAIVPMVANVCGGNMITNEAVLIYTVKKGKLEQMPSFEYFDEGCKAGDEGCNFARSAGVSARYDEKAKAIVIETSFSTDDDAICCPSLFRETWFKWNGSSFAELKKGKITKREVKE